jgi:hypothetical protein
MHSMQPFLPFILLLAILVSRIKSSELILDGGDDKTMYGNELVQSMARFQEEKAEEVAFNEAGYFGPENQNYYVDDLHDGLPRFV